MWHWRSGIYPSGSDGESRVLLHRCEAFEGGNSAKCFLHRPLFRAKRLWEALEEEIQRNIFFAENYSHLKRLKGEIQRNVFSTELFAQKRYVMKRLRRKFSEMLSPKSSLHSQVTLWSFWRKELSEMVPSPSSLQSQKTLQYRFLFTRCSTWRLPSLLPDKNVALRGLF